MEIKVIRLLKEKELALGPVGDIQYGAQGCDVGKLQRHIEYGLEHDWYFVGMGDYLDTFSPSNQRAILSAKVGLYESARSLIDEAVERRVTELVDGPLAGSEDRWLGLVQGDHTYTFEDGTPVDGLIANKLGGAYLGDMGILHVYLGKCPRPLKVALWHGSGASVSSTGKTLGLERVLNAFDVDIVLAGHSHLKYGVPIDRNKSVEMPNGEVKLVTETKIIGITGSFLTGYEAGTRNAAGWPEGSYAEKKMLRPYPTGGLLINVHPVEEEWGWRMDMFVSA